MIASDCVKTSLPILTLGMRPCGLRIRLSLLRCSPAKRSTEMEL